MVPAWAKSLIPSPRSKADRAIEAEARAIARSGLFDPSYYLINGSDVMAAGADPLRHFCRHGWREGRRPNLFFDPTWYCDRYLGGIGPGVNPLVQYIRRGERAGCRPICFFDPAWYRATYALARRVSPLAHYLEHRRSQRVAPNAWFDLGFYLGRHGDEIGTNRDPFMHHVRNGAALRDLDPSPAFDAARYRREVMTADTKERVGLASHEMRVPLIHYLEGSAPSRQA